MPARIMPLPLALRLCKRPNVLLRQRCDDDTVPAYVDDISVSGVGDPSRSGQHTWNTWPRCSQLCRSSISTLVLERCPMEKHQWDGSWCICWPFRNTRGRL